MRKENPARTKAVTVLSRSHDVNCGKEQLESSKGTSLQIHTLERQRYILKSTSMYLKTCTGDIAVTATEESELVSKKVAGVYTFKQLQNR